MRNPWYWLAGAAMAGATAVLSWRPLRGLGREVRLERARESFRLQRERLEASFMAAARATGKPRGLMWKNCEFEPELTLARERRTGQLIGLVPVTISFEAVAGGPMDGVEAVGNLRNATAVFEYARGHWTTSGRAVFNLNPDEAIDHFRAHYERAGS
jgi:hypothetical protein